jgi:hypothetical protein
MPKGNQHIRRGIERAARLEVGLVHPFERICVEEVDEGALPCFGPDRQKLELVGVARQEVVQ